MAIYDKDFLLTQPSFVFHCIHVSQTGMTVPILTSHGSTGNQISFLLNNTGQILATSPAL